MRKLIKQWLGAMTTAERNLISRYQLSPGDRIWNSTDKALQVWDGTKWISVGAGGFNLFSRAIVVDEDFIYPDYTLNPLATENYKWRGEVGAGETLQIEDPGINGILYMATPNSFAGPFLTLKPQTVAGIKKSWLMYTRFKAQTKLNAVYCVGLCDSVTRFYIGSSVCILVSYFQSVIPNNFCLITQIDPFTAFFYDTGIPNDDTFHEWLTLANSLDQTLELYHKNKVTDEWELVVTVNNPVEIPLTAPMKLGIYIGDQNAVPPGPTEARNDVIYFEVDRDLS
jgi:hypothetical protein